MTARTYVFGYGSLVEPRPGAWPAALSGFERRWGVAMDNRSDLPGYKYWVAPGGERPAVHVCFLDVVRAADPGAAVDGLCLPVADDVALASLDARERNYERLEVTGAVRGAPAGARVWTYVGSAAGRRRFARGVAGGTAVIAASYLAAVPAGVGDGGLPVLELERREL